MKSLVSFPRYEGYKDSGVDWLGDIPVEWETQRLKYILQEVNERSHKGLELLLSVSQYTGVTPRKTTEKESDLALESASLEGYKLVEENDLVSNIMLAWNGSLGFSKYFGIVSPAYAVYRLYKNFYHGYYHYLFITDLYKAEYKRKSTGVIDSRLRLYTESFYSIEGLVPPYSEQKLIATYLDQKTAQIDQAIDIKKKQIELLKERQQVVIQQAVTKGLDPSVKMKNSGVEWIGEVPEHWEIKVLKHLLSEPLKYGANESGYEYHKDLPRYIRITDFSDEGKLSEKNKLSLPWVIGKDYLLKDGDILLARSGATVGKSYQFKRYMSEENFYCFAGYLIKATANPEIMLSDYLNLYLNSDCFLTWRNLIFNRATIENIGADKYAVLPVIVPSVIEQKKILKSIRKQSTVIDNLRAQHLNQIKNLQEYKSSLINSAVTGKIKITPDMIAAEG